MRPQLDARALGSTRGCSGAPNHRTPCPQEPLGLQFLHGHTRSYMRDARHLSGLRLPAPSSGKPSLVTFLCCSPLCLFVLASLLPRPRVRRAWPWWLPSGAGAGNSLNTGAASEGRRSARREKGVQSHHERRTAGEPTVESCVQQQGRTPSMTPSGRSKAADSTHTRKPVI